MNDLEWLFHVKIRFRSALLESERLNVRNNTTSAILWCYVHCMHQLASLGRHEQLTRCFSAVAELLVDSRYRVLWVGGSNGATSGWFTSKMAAEIVKSVLFSVKFMETVWSQNDCLPGSDSGGQQKHVDQSESYYYYYYYLLYFTFFFFSCYMYNNYRFLLTITLLHRRPVH